MKPTLLAALVSCCFLFGCGGEDLAGPAPAQVERGSSALEGAFESAARQYQVPVEVLKGIAWVETRVSTQANLESGSGGVGVMQLARRGDIDTLARAAKLTGAAEGALRVDPRANITGAAAVLRELFERSQRSLPSLDAREPGDWYDAVSHYPGFDSAAAATDYATDVFRALEAGFTARNADGSVVQRPFASRWRDHAPAVSVRRDAAQEYPAAAGWVASPNYSSGRSSYEFVLIHTMQGSYAGTKSWFQNSSSNVSSHYIVRSSDGEVTQMVEHKNTAWHAQCYNGRSIGIEHEGYVQDPARWYTDKMYTESARLTRWIADRHGIPKTRSRIIGHVEVPSNCNTGGHTDPGSGWNWTKYMNLVNGATPTQSTGVFIGAIYTGGSSSNRVSGATVKVGTQTVTTGADGLYQFTLAPGSYTATVTKAGFSTTSVTRTVTANAQIWGSMEINPSAATGTLSGKVYAYNAATPSDTSAVISGAAVKVAGQTQTTGAAGTFSFTLAPGTYMLEVSKSGFATLQLSRTVTAGATTSAAVGLSSATATDTQPPQVAIAFPADGASLDLGRITLQGTASDDRGAVSAVKVSVNGGAASDVPVTAGAFSVELLLAPGSNTLTVSAVDAAGNTGRDSTMATFNAGVAGFVHQVDDDTVRIANATIELREAASGTVVSTVTSDASGAYFAPVMTVPADYLLVVRKAGFLTRSETVTVPEDARLALNVGMTPGEDPAVMAELTFIEPADESTVNAETVTLYGVVKGFDLASVDVNGVTAELLGAGGFSATVPLENGPNVITAKATGTTGQTVSAALTIYRGKSGPGGTNANSGCGCSTGNGAEVLWLAALALPWARRRRSHPA